MTGGGPNPNARAEVLTWDWREQPDLDHLARIVRDISGGTVHIHQVATGSDEYAIIVVGVELDDAAVGALYRHRFHEED